MNKRNASLIALLEAFQDKQSWIWSLMNDDQRNRSGKIDDWASKDHLAHANFWTDRVIAQLKIALGEETPERLGDFTKTNEETFVLFKDHSWQKLQLWSEQVHNQLLEALASIPAEDLEDPERFEWTNHRPLWNQVVFTGVYHRIQHACDTLTLCDKAEHVMEIQEQFSQMMEALDDSPEWRGNTQYNLACYYALDGNLEAALETIQAALGLNPKLIEWSKQDSDLDSLRELPEFQALYEQ
ncbi:MAG: ClbS/DfsB family four-helix bundle protein [Anaerolineales bacterium]|nr:MAG: ClbS/DfsB family four-helix bundle protein [Anaerolineales bacterium]